MLNIGIVGFGWPGKQHFKGIQTFPDKMKLTAACDAVEQAMVDLPQHVQRYTDLDRFLEEAPIDAVVLALPHHLHVKYAIRAMENGKHVLIEKPMACNVAECEEMNKTARKTGKTLMVAQNWRYTPWCNAVKKIVDAGELGTVRMIKSEWLLNIHGNKPQSNWIYDGELAGGGAVISLASHNLDFLRFLFGEVKTVYGKCLETDDWSRNGAENWAMAQIEFSNGIVAQLFTGFSAYNSHDGGWLNVYADDGTLYHGTSEQGKGLWITSRSLRDGVPAHVASPFESLQINHYVPEMHAHPQTNQMLHFANCCLTGNQSISSGYDNIKTIELIEAIYTSSREGRVVSLGQ